MNSKILDLLERNACQCLPTGYLRPGTRCTVHAQIDAVRQEFDRLDAAVELLQGVVASRDYEINALKKSIKGDRFPGELRAALEFYADPSNYIPTYDHAATEPILADVGARARAALVTADPIEPTDAAAFALSAALDVTLDGYTPHFSLAQLKRGLKDAYAAQ